MKRFYFTYGGYAEGVMLAETEIDYVVRCLQKKKTFFFLKKYVSKVEVLK